MFGAAAEEVVEVNKELIAQMAGRWGRVDIRERQKQGLGRRRAGVGYDGSELVRALSCGGDSFDVYLSFFCVSYRWGLYTYYDVIALSM